MKLVANRQLTGEYGSVHAGNQFEVRDEIANDLVKRELARQPDRPTVHYETKVVTPNAAPGVSARQEPFRHMPVPHDEKPDQLDAASAHVLSEPNLPEVETGVIDSSGRGRTSKPGQATAKR